MKRVVALPGETVQISRKRLSIDGRQAEEPYVVHNDENDYSGTTKPEPYKSRDSFGPYTLPEARFFVLGDNRDTSMDSRYHGPVPRELVVGKALKVAREGSIQDVR